MELQNKENICQYEKTIIEAKTLPKTPMRNPLQDVKNQDVVNRSLKKTGINLTTEMVPKTPTRKLTPTKKISKLTRSLLVYQDKENLPDNDMTLLTKKEVSRSISDAQQTLSTPVVNVIPATPVRYSNNNLNNSNKNKYEVSEETVQVSLCFENSTEPDAEDLSHDVKFEIDSGDESDSCMIDGNIHAEDELNIIDDWEIYVEHEEIHGADTSGLTSPCPHSKISTSNIQENELSPLDTSGSVVIGTDHTYSGIHCNMCNDRSTSNFEKFTESMTVVEQSCSPNQLETFDKNSKNELHTNIDSFKRHNCISDQETMTDPVTPLKSPEMCDRSVQHLIDTVTVACSPIPSEVLGDYTDVACSPIPSQFTADYTNMACSPIPNQITTELSDIGCSPVFRTKSTETATMTNETPVKHDIALQAAPNTMTVMCSPMHRTTKECGISAVSTQVDVTTNTVIVEQLDQGVDVRPMMSAGSTMTEYFLVNSETSMTPVKLLNKKGHRITAEEIRKQHPRTLANKLDTLALEGERYKQEIGKLERERDRLKSHVTELKSTVKEKQKIINDSQGDIDKEKSILKEEYDIKLHELNTRLQESEESCRKLEEEVIEIKNKTSLEKKEYVSEIIELKRKCEDYNKQLSESEEIKSKEIESLKEEIEKRQNDHQMKSAHNLILELQTELAEYKELSDSLKLAEKLQSEFQNVVTDNYRKVRSTADRLMNMKRNLDVQRVDVVKQKIDNDKEAERLVVEQTEMEEKYNNLTHSLETSRSSMMQIESLYESTSADLLCATHQVQILSKELITTKTELDEAIMMKSTLIQQLEDLQENDKAAVKEITNLQYIIQSKDTDYEQFKKWSADKEKKLQTKIDMLEKEKERLDLVVINLQRTVDSLNEDLDILENDLFATREFSSEQASRIVKFDQELTTANQELEQIRQENMELRDSLAVFRGNQDYLQQSIDITERELKKKSSELNIQTTELRESRFLVVQLENKMAGLLQGLRSRAGLDSIEKSGLQSPVSCSKNDRDFQSSRKKLANDVPCSSRKGDQSFLSMVIKAAEGQSDSEYESCKSSPSTKSSRSTSPYIDGITPLDDNMSVICEKLKDRNSIEESPSAASRNKLGFSTNSAFAAVRTGNSTIKARSGTLDSTLKSKSGPLDSTLKSKSGPLDSTVKNMSLMSQSQLEDCNLRLNDQIDCLGETFGEIIRCASIIEKASRLSIADLQLENEELCEQLEICRTSEKSTRDELTLKTSQLTEAEEKIATLTNHITSLSDKIGFYVNLETEVEVLKSQLNESRSQIEQLEAEKKILTNQLKEVLNGVSGESSGNFARYHSDVTSLKLKIQKVKEQLKQREEYHESLAIKASKRMKTLDENWKKAEEEVYKFDQLVDNIRETLINSGLIPKHKESLGRIIRMIDGFESVPSKPELLNPIKTARW